MKNFKFIRQISGLSQGDFSKKYGIPIRSLQSWESYSESSRRAPEYVFDMFLQLIVDDKTGYRNVWATIEDNGYDQHITKYASKPLAVDAGLETWNHLTASEQKKNTVSIALVPFNESDYDSDGFIGYYVNDDIQEYINKQKDSIKKPKKYRL